LLWQKKKFAWHPIIFASEISGNVVIELLNNNQLVGTISSGVAATVGTFEWTVGQLENGTFVTGSTFKIRIHGSNGSVLSTKNPLKKLSHSQIDTPNYRPAFMKICW